MKVTPSILYPEKTIKHFKMLPSTNDYAQKWLQSDVLPPEASIVVTDNQTNGRGQATNQWLANAGENLTFSMIFYPEFLGVDRLFALNMIASLAVHYALQPYLTTSVKWPNDVLIGSKKVAGILIRNTLAGKKISTSIIGVGLNVNQLDFGDLLGATSLALSTGKKLDKECILNAVISEFEQLYQKLKSGQYTGIKKEYLAHLYQWEEVALYTRKDGSNFEGRIVDVAENGQLVMEVDKKLEHFQFKEIKFI